VAEKEKERERARTYTCGWTRWIVTSFSASRRISEARTVTDVVPSPTSSSWTLEMLTRILAAGLSRAMLLRMVAPSLVTVISPVEVEWRILFMPLGPRVDLTRSPRARAPTKDERRACEERIGSTSARGRLGSSGRMLCVCCSYSSRAQPGPWRDKASSPCARRARARPLEGPSPKLLRLSRHRPSGQGPYSARLSRSKRRLEERKGEAGKWTRVAARAGDGARERVREDGGWLTGADERWREGTDILCALLGSLWTRDAECEGQREGAMSWETATTTRGRSGGGGEGAHLVAKDVGRHGAQAGPSRGERGGERAARRPLSLRVVSTSRSRPASALPRSALSTPAKPHQWP